MNHGYEDQASRREMGRFYDLPFSSEFGRDVRGEEPRIASGDADIHISFAEQSVHVLNSEKVELLRNLEAENGKRKLPPGKVRREIFPRITWRVLYLARRGQVRRLNRTGRTSGEDRLRISLPRLVQTRTRKGIP